jgi:hypothetical protein
VPFTESFSGRRRTRCALVLACAIGVAACASRSSAPPAAPAPGPASPSGAPITPAAGKARDWKDFQRIAANRLVQANPGGTYLGVPPEPLLAIPVLEVELNGNGTVRRINVMRQPSQALDTVKLATDAVQRAAPFGDVSHLPRPWRFTEVFLFDDNRRFKPRTLD